MPKTGKDIDPIDGKFEEVASAMVSSKKPTHGSGDEIAIPKATHQGQMPLGDLVLDCYVLDDGRRVFHKRGMARALGMKSTGGNAFMKVMGRKGIGSAMPEILKEKIDNPITFKPLTQDLGHGYPAEVLSDVAKAILEAERMDLLAPSQRSLADQARILLNAFAGVGVIALIDEATGYQQIRDPQALRLLVQQYIEEEMRQWEKQFPDAYYDELNRLYGSRRFTKNASGAVIQNRPQHFGNFTRKYVYHPLENGAVLEELDRVNPTVNARGDRKSRFHQHLTEGYGLEKLKAQVRDVMTLMSVSESLDEFKKLFGRKFPEPAPLLDE